MKPDRIRMKIRSAVLFVCMIQLPANASELGQDNVFKDVTPAIGGRHLSQTPFVGMLAAAARDYMVEEQLAARQRPSNGYAYESAFARAIARAAKRSASELALEAATKIIIMCQKERNPALTTPFFRSDSQQAHCFRY